jgi:hypothetical protein
MALSEQESDSESSKKQDQIQEVLGSLGICTRPYGYMLEYFDSKSLSCCCICDKQFETYFFALEHCQQTHFLEISQIEKIIDIPL